MSSAFIDVTHTFNPINEEEELNLEQDMMRNCSISSTGSHIDIHGQPVSSDILVALLDRHSEMKDLVSRNYQFYETIQHYIIETQGNDAWVGFQDIIYKPRQKLPDRVWMNQISQYLVHNPVFLTKFKEIVGYEQEDDEDEHQPPIVYRKLSHSSSNSGGHTRRRSRRLSNMSLGEDDDDSITYEEAPKITEGIFNAEDPFHHGRRRRSSYHSIQSEPHPTFVDVKIDEVDEANIDQDDSDHLADLLDDDDDDDDDNYEEVPATGRVKEIGAGYSTPSKPYSDMDLIKLRDFPEVQENLTQMHPSFFRKAKQLLSLAPSSRRFSATIRRNSILEDAMPPSPVTELDEPRMQTCIEEEEDKDGHLAHLICCTRRQQPDDIAWLNSVMEALSGWPELLDRLHEIIQESLEDKKYT